MVDTKISALTDGVTVVATDRIPVARSPFAPGNNNYVTGTELSTFIASTNDIRERISADKDLYVRSDGNDANDGLTNTAGGAKLTIQAAVSVAALLDTDRPTGGFQAYTANIHVGAGTFGGCVIRGSELANSRPIKITGAGTTSTFINCSSAGGVYIFRGSVDLTDLCFVPTGAGGIGIYADHFAFVDISRCKFTSGGFAGETAIYALDNAHTNVTTRAGTTNITGNWDVVFRADGLGIQQVWGAITITGTPAWGTCFAYASRLSDICWFTNSGTITGSATGTRFKVISGGSINGSTTLFGPTAKDVLTPTFFPGDSRGTSNGIAFYDGYIWGQPEIASNFASGEQPNIIQYLNATSANNDFIGGLDWEFNDSAGGKTSAGGISLRIIDNTAASEDVQMFLGCIIGGSFTNATQIRIADGVVLAALGDSITYPGTHNLGFKTGKGIWSDAGTEFLLFTKVASAINEFTISHAASGGHPSIAATGGGTDINVVLTPKGSGGVTTTGYIKALSTTFGGLPSAATAGSGARAFITDCNTATFLATAAAGGANKVPVISDGTNWLVG